MEEPKIYPSESEIVAALAHPLIVDAVAKKELAQDHVRDAERNLETAKKTLGFLEFDLRHFVGQIAEQNRRRAKEISAQFEKEK